MAWTVPRMERSDLDTKGGSNATLGRPLARAASQVPRTSLRSGGTADGNGQIMLAEERVGCGGRHAVGQSCPLPPSLRSGTSLRRSGGAAAPRDAGEGM